MAEGMQVRNYADRTIDSYTWHVDKFCQYFGKPADQLGPEEIRSFQLYLINEKKASWSSFNQAVCGLRFLYQVTLAKPWTVQDIPYGKRPKKLPMVLSDQEAARLIECVENPKHRAVLLTCYAVGLMLAEATHLKVADIDGLRRLIMQGKLRLEGPWSRLLDPACRETWLAHLQSSDWNVFIEGPPKGNSVLKYLARYLTGGPISDRRIVSDDNGQVTFLARSRDKQAGNPQIEIELPGTEFLRRWSMHILPKSFTKSRYYGGYHGSKRDDYLAQCRSLLPNVKAAESEPPSEPAALDPAALEPAGDNPPPLRKCARCDVELILVTSRPRPSWKVVFGSRSYSSHPTVLPVDGLSRNYIPDD